MNFFRHISVSSILVTIAGCSVSMPFKWVAGPVQNASASARLDEEVLVAVTHARVDGAKRKLFDEGATRVLASLASQPGLVGYSVRRQIFGDEVWTATIWTDEASMIRFVRSPDHVRAASESRSAVRSIEYFRLRVRRSALPVSWRQLLSAPSTSNRQPG
jgi:heme-degrading monooxygenase HmoA